MAGPRFAIAFVCVALCASACATPRDDFDVARDSLGRGDLLTTIVHLDRVPPTHPEYLEARSLARAVERRMRTGQRLFQRGLHLRAEWRDEEAIESFELARQVWPCIGGVDRMIDATRERMRSLAPSLDPDPEVLPETAVATTSPVTDKELGDDGAVFGPVLDGSRSAANRTAPTLAETPIGPPAPNAKPDELASAPPTATDGGESPDDAASDAPDAPPASSPQRLVRLQIAKATADLAAGRLEEALDALDGLYVHHPESTEVRELLMRVLHQRALLLYGQGQLQAALESWAKILAIDPDHQQAREFYRAAETELHALRAAPPR